MQELTKDQILNKLRTSRDFLIAFTIDNNPEAVISKLREEGYQISTDQEAYGVISALVTQGDTNSALQALNVPYLDTAENYTGGLFADLDQQRQDTIKAAAPSEGGPQAFNVLGVLTTVGAIGEAIWGTGTPEGEGGTTDPSVTQAQQQAREAEEKAARAKNTLIIVGAVLGTAVLVLGIGWLMSKKGKS